ncbi:hypothetical protein L7F22_024101 [Adiantum nelumboides]|nr:hypothetical protein [Adiantum nelumboides]
MGDAMKADGAFIGQDASVTPLIGKIRLHIQGYVEKEDFFISPLKHEDVILGAPWFDRRFIEKVPLIAGPLHDLAKKNVKNVWTERKQEVFDKLKQKLTSQPELVLPDFSKSFEVQCDACGDCLGAVLLQEGHAIAYESRRLSSNEKILGIYEKDLLAVLHALDSWKHYLLWTPFILRTDRQSLKYIMTQAKLSDKQMRHYGSTLIVHVGKDTELEEDSNKVQPVSVTTTSFQFTISNGVLRGTTGAARTFTGQNAGTTQCQSETATLYDTSGALFSATTYYRVIRGTLYQVSFFRSTSDPVALGYWRGNITPAPPIFGPGTGRFT